MKIVQERFDSLDAMIKTIMRRKPNRVFIGEDLSSETGGKRFTGTESLEEAMDIMKKGYTEPLAQIKKSLSAAKIKSNTPVPKVRPTIGVVGFAPCVPNAIRGLPNSMIATERVAMKAKVLTIMYCVSVNSDVNKDRIIKAGVAVLQLINDLELKGYRVRLDIEFIGSQERKEFASVTATVKDWRQHIDLKKLAFPLVHPSALRRIGFRWLETVPNLTNRGYRDGYGRAKNADGYKSAKEFYQKNGLVGENTYYINVGMVERCNHDIKKMMETCGMAQVVAKGER